MYLIGLACDKNRLTVTQMLFHKPFSTKFYIEAHNSRSIIKNPNLSSWMALCSFFNVNVRRMSCMLPYSGLDLTAAEVWAKWLCSSPDNHWITETLMKESIVHLLLYIWNQSIYIASGISWDLIFGQIKIVKRCSDLWELYNILLHTSLKQVSPSCTTCGNTLDLFCFPMKDAHLQ